MLELQIIMIWVENIKELLIVTNWVGKNAKELQMVTKWAEKS